MILSVGLLRDHDSAGIYAIPSGLLAGGVIARRHSQLYSEILDTPIVPRTAIGSLFLCAEQLLLPKVPILYLSLFAVIFISAVVVPKLPEGLRSWIVAASS